MFWDHTFSRLLSGHWFVVPFRDFYNFGCQKGLQNVLVFLPGMARNSTWASKSSQRSPQTCPEAPKATKMEPKDTKMSPRRLQNGGKWKQRTVPLRKNTWSLEAKSPVEKGTVAARRAANWIYIYTVGWPSLSFAGQDGKTRLPRQGSGQVCESYFYWCDHPHQQWPQQETPNRAYRNIYRE